MYKMGKSWKSVFCIKSSATWLSFMTKEVISEQRKSHLIYLNAHLQCSLQGFCLHIYCFLHILISYTVFLLHKSPSFYSSTFVTLVKFLRQAFCCCASRQETWKNYNRFAMAIPKEKWKDKTRQIIQGI